MTLILPPCVKKAAAARDSEAYDEIFSYLRCFADHETREAVLWSIGYYDLSNYQHRKLTAEAQIRSAPIFVCTPLEKPEHLAKYCTTEDEAECPLRDPLTKFEMLIESVYLKPDYRWRVATLEVHLRDGTVFRRVNGVYTPPRDAPFWRRSAEMFAIWYEDTHRGKYPDFVYPDVDELAAFLMKKAVVVGVEDNDATTVRQENVI